MPKQKLSDRTIRILDFRSGCLAIFVNYFCLERTNQLSLLPDKDLVDLCSPIEPYQVTKSPTNF
ncbi:MAG: hypothetical protein EWV88_19955 [Microcystis wesenbergii Mw_MB_S_20031200_S109D]|uniref:Uncharacterized protein n=1 Tax=Microcystis wesenbergii Mw_MB_S_20031200_S109D TaxID=2486241 RepID=A0A552LEU9_9CHRO|nr:MAG: hypothetical protein EWV88_19955 [Microcystis wesenbergii Mw_MB_S_20031200_S109D]